MNYRVNTSEPSIIYNIADRKMRHLMVKHRNPSQFFRINDKLNDNSYISLISLNCLPLSHLSLIFPLCLLAADGQVVLMCSVSLILTQRRRDERAHRLCLEQVWYSLPSHTYPAKFTQNHTHFLCLCRADLNDSKHKNTHCVFPHQSLYNWSHILG